jgi:hypothetical protein
MGISCVRYGEKRVADRIFVRKPKMKKPLGRPRTVRKINTNMNL